VLNQGGAIHGIIIPRNGSWPTLVRLLDLKGKYWTGSDLNSFSFGYHSTVTIRGKTPPKMINYSWPDGSHDSPLCPSKFLNVELNADGWKHFAFDECSGRVVGGCDNEVMVYDFARF